MFRGKTILVTGGAGFIGSHLSRSLVSQGARVINIDDFNNFYDPRLKHQNIAALKEPRLYLETNVTGTLNLLEQMRQYAISKIVFASSSSVYGNRTDPPFREDQDTSKPISPYAATKMMGESLLHSYCHLYGICGIALRFFTVYGPGQRPDLAIAKFTRQIDEGVAIPVFGDGSTQRDYTYIEDILQGVLGAMAYDKTPFEIFNLGESRSIKLFALITLIENALGKSAILNRQPMQPGDVLMTCADITKARTTLGYNPQVPIEDGIQRYISWYRENRDIVALTPTSPGFEGP